MKSSIWFRSKKYGWGWFPANWKGWTVTFLYLFSVFVSIYLVKSLQPPHQFLETFLFIFSILTAVFLFLCFLKGEKLHWNWGDPSNINKKL
jgi:hypothetical protein